MLSFCFLFFGVAAVCGSYFVQTGSLSASALTASIPVGLTVTAILVVNNIRDIDTDRAAGKQTLAVMIGRRASRVQYATLLAAAFLLPPLLWAAELAPAWASLACAATPFSPGIDGTIYVLRFQAGVFNGQPCCFRLHQTSTQIRVIADSACKANAYNRILVAPCSHRFPPL